MKPLVVSFSAGETSARMAHLLNEKYKGKRDIINVFANTGKELEETLLFAAKVDEYFKLNTVWLESVQYHGQRNTAGFNIVDFDSASRNGEPFEDMIVKHGIPNKAYPHCTRELKTNPINNYLKSLGLDDYEMAIGIRYDEPKRLKDKPNIIYPMAKEFRHTKGMVNDFWRQQNFRLNIKGYQGNCDLCWKKSKRKHLTLLLENPSIADWWNEMEIKYGYHIPPTQALHRITPITFFRQHESVQELLEDSKMPFEKATDDRTLYDVMFSMPELDFTDGCEESCEAF